MSRLLSLLLFGSVHSFAKTQMIEKSGESQTFFKSFFIDLLNIWPFKDETKRSISFLKTNL